MERYYNRVSKDKNPDYKEVLRRLIADVKAFDDFGFKDIIINQDKPLSVAVNEVNDIIRGYEKWC